ncbi:MAG: hypothetical protein MJ236_00900 [Clostridia bacterium]|nr:hypothetical protein [Clostridia bacterium]
MSVVSSVGKANFELIELFGRKVIFTEDRIFCDSIPSGLFKYEIRHDDSCLGEEAEIAEKVYVNFWGTVISAYDLMSIGDRFREIGEDDIEYLGLKCDIDEYARQNYREIDKNKLNVVCGKRIVEKEYEFIK